MTVVQRSPTAGIHGVGGLRWVPVYTGTTAGDGAPHTVGATARPHRHSRDSGRRRTSHRHSRDGGNPRRGEPAMGSRLHGNDGRRTPHGRRHIVIPATAGIHGVGRRRWVPVSTGTTVAPHIVIPATAGIHGVGSLRWVPVSTGTTVGGGAPHTVGDGAPTSSFPRRRESTAGGACDGFPSPRERRRTHMVIPATAGIHGGGRHDGFPSPRERRKHPHRHSRDGGNPRRGEPAMGSRLHGNDGSTGTSSFPRRRESTAWGRLGWVPVYTGTTVFPRRRDPAGGHGMGSRLHGNDGSPHIVIAATAGIHGVGACDGFPSPRERR